MSGTSSVPCATPRADPQLVVRLLRAHQIAPTAQRIRVGELIFGAAQHLTADQVLAGLRAGGVRIAKATVYNTLNLFAAHGLLKQISVDSHRTYFDTNTADHHHFHDLETGELADIEAPQVRFEQLPLPPPDMELAGVDVVLRLRRKRQA